MAWTPHVHVVAHGDALSGQREHVNRSGPVESLGQGRTERVPQEPEALDGGVGVDAEPGDLPRALIQAGVGSGAAGID